MTAITASPPRLQNHGWPTRFQKEQEAAGIDLGRLPDDLESIGPWILGDMIGKGSSGRVKLGRHKHSGKIAAIKIISKNPMLSSKTGIADMDAKHQKALRGIHREIVIMKLINHPCIMSLYDLQETENEFYLALEYVEGGELFDYLVSRGRLSEPEALNYFKQIIFGLDYCHRFNISHRDLKPENILLDGDMNIKIADFGMAALEVANGMLETSCGSPHYASPEVVAGKAYHGASSDIWSCGVVLYALLSGRLPFDHRDIRTLLQMVKLGKFEMHECLSPKAEDLIARMLVVDPEARITIPEIFRHPFFRGETNVFFRNPDPPTLEDLSKPIGPREHIESAYLGSLQILFHKSRADIETALRVRNEPNWEKAFLYLLRVYAERVRENYGEEDGDEVEVVPVRRRSTRLQVERDVFADITTRLNLGARRSVDVRPPVKLSVPPLGRKRALTVSTGPQFAFPPIPSPAKLVAARAAPLHANGESRRAGRAHEDSDRWSRPPSVVGPRPNPPVSPSRANARPRSGYLEPGPVAMVRERPGSGMARANERAGTSMAYKRPSSAMAHERPRSVVAQERTTSVMTRETPGSGMVLRDWDMHRVASPPPLPPKSPAKSTFQDVAIGAEPTPFRSVLSPDPDKSFGDEYVHILKRWSEDTDEGETRRREEDREVAKKSNLSPHAPEFRLGMYGLPVHQTKLVRKSKPTPLALANPNWHSVSSASQPGTPGLDSPRLGQQPKVTGWFQNLFTFRPVFHVLYSTVPPELTRHEITQMLSDFGVAVTKQQDQELLKCYVDKFHDLDGTLMAKSVRFRIEIRSTGGSPTLADMPLRSPMLELPGTQYPCVLTITQEKGAHSTLKAVYARLRASWRLDSLVSPAPVSAGSTMTTQTPMLE
ncbi:hypothetical protein FRC10_009205 [Ceratobasidium sp. 414]|nr:hypothetical protein FRC10_009205 [Ceratobasidium sp. 414]